MESTQGQAHRHELPTHFIGRREYDNGQPRKLRDLSAPPPLATAFWLLCPSTLRRFFGAQRRPSGEVAAWRLYLLCSRSPILTDLVSVSAFSFALKHLIRSPGCSSVNRQTTYLGAYLSRRRLRIRVPSVPRIKPQASLSSCILEHCGEV